jgi:prepilin-type N-terminal cleavage/methylation domain-containing protein
VERFRESRKRLAKARRLNREGFTVIEVAVAMIVLSVGLLGMAATIPMMKTDVVQSDQRTNALFHAQEASERLRGLTYADSLLLPGTHSDPNFNVPNYTRAWTVEQNIPIAGVKRITVTVTRTGQPDEGATLVFLHAEAGR